MQLASLVRTRGLARLRRQGGRYIASIDGASLVQMGKLGMGALVDEDIALVLREEPCLAWSTPADFDLDNGTRARIY